MNMGVLRKIAVNFSETQEFADIINAIGEAAGIPMKIIISEDKVSWVGNLKTKQAEARGVIYFSQLGYPNLSIRKKTEAGEYNEVQMVAFSIFEFFKQQKKETDACYSFGFPQDENHSLSSKGSEWSLTFRKELVKGEKSWVTYAVLAVCLGAYGVHNFYAGQKKKGIIKLVITCTFIGAAFMELWAWEEAYQAYQNKKIPE